MPKAVKQRGRRAVEKQKKEATGIQDEAHIEEPVAKRRKVAIDETPQEIHVEGDAGDDYIHFGATEDNDAVESNDQQTTFYGLLTDEEQEYYAKVNTKITTDDFENDEERSDFIEAVYRESAGKEIKLASSQSCSRHLEKIIQLSTQTQLKALFRAFIQDLQHLMQHRFGSHCCETLFVHSAQYVEEDSKQKKKQKSTTDDDTFQSLYLEVTGKIEENAGFLVTEKFASHCLRVILLVLSGEPIQDKSTQRAVASKKKEGIEAGSTTVTALAEHRKVPQRFNKARHQLIKSIADGLDPTYLRALATSTTGNPVLQLLLRIELKEEKQDSEEQEHPVFNKLVPDQSFNPESDSSKFISSLVYDATGAHLVQTLVKHLPGKLFKKMYRNLFKERVAKLAKNDIASYVAVDIFERVGRDDLTDAAIGMTEETPGLIKRNRLAPLRAYIERCSKRGVVHFPLRTAVVDAYGESTSKWPATLLHKMLKLDIPSSALQGELPEDVQAKLKVDMQGSLLAQTLLRVESFAILIHDALLCESADILEFLSTNPISTRIVQIALTSETSSRKFLRTIMSKFEPILLDLAIHPVGSFVVDALWTATRGQHFMKEKFAGILAENEQSLRDSHPGRQVWRNWHLELYRRKNREWVEVAKGWDKVEEQAASTDPAEKPAKSGIELARERAAAKAQAKKASGANTVVRVTRSTAVAAGADQ